MSRHNFPVPQKQFGTEVYLLGTQTFPGDFYARLFGWELSETQVDKNHSRITIAAQGQIVAETWNDPPFDNQSFGWSTMIKVTDPIGALGRVSVLEGNKRGRVSDAHVPSDLLFLEDADGELVCLTGA